MALSTDTIISNTKKWIADVVVGCNFCPFAGRVLKMDSIHYEILPEADLQKSLEKLALCFRHLDSNENTETLLLIFPNDYK